MSILSALHTSRRPATAFVLIGLFWGCFAAHVPVFKEGLGVNDAIFGTLLLGSATGLVASMFLAPLADRILKARSMQVGAVMLAFAWLLPAVAFTPLLFAISLAFVGMASGLLDVVMNARVSELEAKTGCSLMNANHAMFSVGYAVGAIVVSFTREAGIPPVFVFAAFGVIALFTIGYLQMEVADVQAEDGYVGSYPLWPIFLCGAIVLVAFMSEATVEAWSALHIERTLGGGAAEGAFGPAMLGITMAFGRFSGQAVSDRLREVHVVYWASAIAAIGAIIAATAVSPLYAYIGFGILGLGVSVIGPMGLALVGKVVPPHMRTEAISKVAVIGFSGFFLAPVLMGFVSEAFGLRMAFFSVAGLLLVAVPLARMASNLPENGRGS